jgi:hypothetical protein
MHRVQLGVQLRELGRAPLATSSPQSYAASSRALNHTKVPAMRSTSSSVRTIWAWVINKHGKTGEKVHRIGCIHFYDDLPSTRQSPKMVGTTWEALKREEPRLEEIARCLHCG